MLTQTVDGGRARLDIRHLLGRMTVKKRLRSMQCIAVAALVMVLLTVSATTLQAQNSEAT